MKEALFVEGLVGEIKRSKDPRFQAVNEWCTKIAQQLKSCTETPNQFENHVALVTWSVLVALRCIEDGASDQKNEAEYGYTPCNELDIVVPRHGFNIDYVKKTVTVTAVAYNTSTSSIDVTVALESLVLPITMAPEAPQESQIILP